MNDNKSPENREKLDRFYFVVVRTQAKRGGALEAE